ncbi:pentatricopeptide repeat-containing protein At1g08070, chloroplastic-like [Argentina anserina]|uniref:pentatricopeptide repeat-containing protein At1g08070, chloroplastic-like n=1 Tax=Argentina anserina TaxID=57926 RepID=UPI0021767719|nr:pentatricopeptide repeat-containing protein At1g08070, chloroplastic-like [Potentilla anserina]
MILNPPHFPATKTRQPFSTLSSLLNLCTKPKTLLQLHARYVLYGRHQDPCLSSLLIHRYAALGLPSLSLNVFNSILSPTRLHYNAILTTLAESESTITFYNEMVMKGMYPDEGTYPYVLGSCSRFLDDSRMKARVHGHVVKLGLDSCDVVGRALADMYGNSGEFENEGKVCDEMPHCGFKSGDLVKWLRSSVDLKSLRVGKAVHCVAVVTNLCGDLSVNTALLSMYAKLGELECAKLVFDEMPERDCVVWNIMISGYSRNGRPEEALELLRFMVRSGVRADMFSAIPAISSIARLRASELGREMHAHVIRNGSDYQVSVHNSLIDMYCECNRVSCGRRIFDMVKDKTVVSWSAMIKGYVTHERSLDALALFSEMKSDGVGVDFITIINILPACVDLGALENVKYFHGYSMKLSLNALSSISTAFLVSYAKCGCIEMARKLFDEENINEKDVITWNSMIGAYAKHGDWYRSFELYKQMKGLYIKPDQVTFLGLLTACVNAGLVQEGKKCFKEMIDIYGYKPSQEHYACMADLLGRAGEVNEASELIKSMPFKPDARVWGPLLSACKLHSDTGVADFAAEKLITMEPENAGNLILLANIKAAAGKWDEVANIRRSLRDMGLKKTPGCSWVEINGRRHEFRVADRSHPRSEGIYAMLRNLELESKEANIQIHV